MIHRLAALLGATFILLAAPASAEVVSRSENGFVLRFEMQSDASPEQMIAAVRALPEWWDPAHTYTGDADNLSLAFEPGGCWCEARADGTTFRHAEVVEIAPNRVTMNAPLGPLHGRATRADLAWTIGGHTPGDTIALQFTVEGPGLGPMADPVHTVMSQGWSRYVHYLTSGEAPPST